MLHIENANKLYAFIMVRHESGEAEMYPVYAPKAIVDTLDEVKAKYENETVKIKVFEPSYHPSYL